MTNHPYYDFFRYYFDNMIDCMSLHYPFTAEQVIRDIRHLKMGTAYYSAYNSDTDTIWQATIGLSFNKSMEWTDEVKALWDMPLLPYNKCPYAEERPLPLDVNEGLQVLDMLMFRQNYTLWPEEENYHMHSEVPSYLLHPITYPQLSYDELLSLCKRDMREVVLNPSIWQNTMCKILTSEVVEGLIQMKRDGYYIN